MKYISELSMFSLLVFAVYAVLPGTVESRALDTGNYIAEDGGENTGDNSAVQRLERELGDFIEAYLANRNLNAVKRNPANDLYARAAYKRNLREGMREALAKRGYLQPVDIVGGYISDGTYTGTGR